MIDRSTGRNVEHFGAVLAGQFEYHVSLRPTDFGTDTRCQCRASRTGVCYRCCAARARCRVSGQRVDCRLDARRGRRGSEIVGDFDRASRRVDRCTGC